MVPEKTPNLKLKKPDYENGVADIRIFNENWDILDEASKKIENEMTETNDKVDNGLNKKLNKGTYEGDADDLKREIDGKEPAFSKKSGFNLEKTDNFIDDANKLLTSKAGHGLKKEVDNKVSKSGDTMTGVLRMEGNTGISFSGKANISFNSMETPTGEVNTLTLWNDIGKISMGLRPDGAAFMQSKNLTTKSKEAIAAINEINIHKVSKSGDTMTGGLKFKDTLYIATADEKVNMGYANGKGQFIIWNGYSQQSIALKDDGAGVFGAKNLNTLNKDVIKAVNELMAFTGYNHKIYWKFPLSSAVVGGLYLHEGNKSIYKCIKSYNGPLLSNPNNHFISMNTYRNNRMICQTVRVVKISGTGSEWKTIEYPETFWANNCAIFIQNTGNFTDKAPVFKINTDRTRYCVINFDGFYYEADMIFLKIWEE